MPFTPYHMGAALLMKPVLQRHFSVITFGFAQVAMDIEPLLGLLNGWDILHGWTHTFLGALLIAPCVAVLTAPCHRPLLRRFNQEVVSVNLHWLAEPEQPTRLAVLSGAFLGTLSHVLLDSLIHYDIRPLAPFSDANPFLNWVSHDGGYSLCVYLGMVGLAGWLMVRWRHRRRCS